MSNTIYKLETTTNKLVRCRELKWGDTFVVTADSHLVQMFDDNPHSDYEIIEIHYKPKKWWQFWKKKIPLFYVIAYVGKNK